MSDKKIEFYRSDGPFGLLSIDSGSFVLENRIWPSVKNYIYLYMGNNILFRPYIQKYKPEPPENLQELQNLEKSASLAEAQKNLKTLQHYNEDLRNFPDTGNYSFNLTTTVNTILDRVVHPLYERDSSLKNLLLQTGNRPIVYVSDNLYLGNTRGENRYGNFLRQYRYVLRNREKRERLEQAAEAREDKIYQTFLVYNYLETLITSVESDLSPYIQKSLENMLSSIPDLSALKLSNAKKEIVVQQFNAGNLPEISLVLSRPEIIASVLRKKHLRTFYQALGQKKKEELLRQFIFYSLDKHYKELKEDTLSRKAAYQSFLEILRSKEDRGQNYIDRLWKLYENNMLSTTLVDRINTYLQNLPKITEEDIARAESFDVENLPPIEEGQFTEEDNTGSDPVYVYSDDFEGISDAEKEWLPLSPLHFNYVFLIGTRLFPTIFHYFIYSLLQYLPNFEVPRNSQIEPTEEDLDAEHSYSSSAKILQGKLLEESPFPLKVSNYSADESYELILKDSYSYWESRANIRIPEETSWKDRPAFSEKIKKDLDNLGFFFKSESDLDETLGKHTRDSYYNFMQFVMVRALNARYLGNRSLLFVLNNTGNAELIYGDPQNGILGVGPGRNGNNAVGKYLEQIRRIYRDSQVTLQDALIKTRDMAPLFESNVILNWALDRIINISITIKVLAKYLEEDITPRFVNKVLLFFYSNCEGLLKFSSTIQSNPPIEFEDMVKTNLSANTKIIQLLWKKISILLYFVVIFLNKTKPSPTLLDVEKLILRHRPSDESGSTSVSASGSGSGFASGSGSVYHIQATEEQNYIFTALVNLLVHIETLRRDIVPANLPPMETDIELVTQILLGESAKIGRKEKKSGGIEAELKESRLDLSKTDKAYAKIVNIKEDRNKDEGSQEGQEDQEDQEDQLDRLEEEARLESEILQATTQAEEDAYGDIDEEETDGFAPNVATAVIPRILLDLNLYPSNEPEQLFRLLLDAVKNVSELNAYDRKNINVDSRIKRRLERRLQRIYYFGKQTLI